MSKRNKKEIKSLLNLMDSLVPPEERLPAITPETAPKQHPGRGPCGKVVYPSDSSAKQAARHRLRYGSNTSRLRTYFCKECSGWHMTSTFRDY